MAAKTRRGDPHQGLPRDANGDPIFWILPQDIRVRYDHRMAACEKAWTQTGDPAAVGEAETWAFLHRQPWLHDAVVQLATNRRTKAHANRVRADALHPSTPTSRCATATRPDCWRSNTAAARPTLPCPWRAAAAVPAIGLQGGRLAAGRLVEFRAAIPAGERRPQGLGIGLQLATVLPSTTNRTAVRSREC